MANEITVVEDVKTITVSETNQVIEVVEDVVTVTTQNGINTIAAALDVNITNPTQSQVLIYDFASSKWINSNTSGDGDVSGPGSSIDDNIVLFDGTTGKLIKDSSVSISAVNANTAKVSFPEAPNDGEQYARKNQSWQIVTSGSVSPLTIKGDIYTFSTLNDRLPVGTDGQYLEADSTTSTGLKWSDFLTGTISISSFAARTTMTNDLSDTNEDLTWDVEIKKDTGFSHTTSSSDIVFDFDGWVDISCFVGITGADNRVQLNLFAYLDTGAGFNQITTDLSRNYAARDDSGQDSGGISLGFLLQVSSGDKIKFNASTSVDSSSVAEIEPAQTRVFIKRIDDLGEGIKGNKGDKGDTGDGDVNGPGSSIDDNIVLFDETTGKLIKDSSVSISAVNANTAKVSFPEAPNDGEQYARKNQSWQIVSAGDVSGPASSVDSRITLFDGTTGKQVKDSTYLISDVLSRANHTGTQLVSTISNFTSSVQALSINSVQEDTTPVLGGNLDGGGNNITGVKTIPFTFLDNGTKTGTHTINFSNAQKQTVTLTANTMTIDFSGSGAGNYLLKIINGGLATITWSGITWAGGVAAILASSGVNFISIIYDGTTWYAMGSPDF